MDEKLAYSSHPSTNTPISMSTMIRPHSRPSRRVVSFYIVALLFCSLLLYHIEVLTPVIRSDNNYLHPATSPNDLQISSNETVRVALEAHIMSKCPDARACLRDLVVPAMEKIGDKVEFQLSFIGEYVRTDSI